MSNKGFSLIELLAVIIVLGILAAIAIPSINSYLEEGKEKTYIQNVAEIEKASKKWVITYGNTVEWDVDLETGIKKYELDLKDLKKTEFIADEYTKNPLEEDLEMSGCVLITLSPSDIYNYKYYEGCEIDE